MKQQDCMWYEPGDVTNIDVDVLSSYLLRTERGDNQRRTEIYYIYAKDNLLMGK